MGYFSSALDRKGFLLGTAKITVALILTFFILRAAPGAIESFNTASLTKPKRWKPITIGMLENSNFYLVTVWRNEKMSYQFEMRAPTSFLENRNNKNSYSAFTLIFLDANGFKVLEDTVLISEMTHLVNDSGNPIGISSKGEKRVSADDYARIASWEFTWPRKWAE